MDAYRERRRLWAETRRIFTAEVSDLDKVDVSLSATSGVATRQTPGGWTSNFTLTMRCLCDNCFGFVSVELQVDPYDPIAIAFFKDCTKSPSPTLPPPSPSWSSTAVAFFVYVLCSNTLPLAPVFEFSKGNNTFLEHDCFLA
jgi:hypothetical protein